MSKFVFLTIICFVSVLNSIADGSTSQLLVYQYQKGNLTIEQFKQQMGDLIDKSSSSREKATLYFEVAKTLANQMVLNREDCVKYAGLVLKTSKDPLERSRSFIIMANALEMENNTTSQEALFQNRKNIVDQYLYAMGAIEQDLRITAPMALPAVNRHDFFDPNPDSSLNKQFMEAHQKEIDQRNYAISQNAYLECKRVASDACTRLYSIEPYNNDEFGRECRVILTDPNWINDLLGRLKSKEASDDTSNTR